MVVHHFWKTKKAELHNENLHKEYEKLRMRQNPMLQPRVQHGGRSMPAWFSHTLVNPTRSVAPSPPPPPLPVEPPPEESDYEEIDHLPKNVMKKSGSRRTCSLCGNPNPAVSCEMCNNQIFCGSCNDMYHRHPKRQHHSRKILEPLDNRPPLPPKTPLPPEMSSPVQALPPLPPHPGGQAGGVPQPVPPPRRKGRFGMRSNNSSPTSGRKFFDPVGTLKRFMGGMAQRPLPSPPKAPPPLPPKSDFVRSMTPTLRGNTLGERRLNSPQPGGFGQEMGHHRAGIPLTVLDMQNTRHHSISVANLSGHTSSRDSGYPDWEEDDDEFFGRGRAHSVSGNALGRFPSTSQDASHFATMHRPGRVLQRHTPAPMQSSEDIVPERPPPPLPPRQFPSQTQLSFQSSQSAFDLDRMAAAQQQQSFGMPPWNYPMPGYPFEFQQAMMMGYPGPGTMHRTPSTQSMGPTMNTSANQQGFFGWGPMGFAPPMTPLDVDMMTAQHRRGSEQFMAGMPPQQQRSIPLSNPVTPQGSFRKKVGRHMSVEPELTRRLERIDLSQNRRSGTPSSFVRVASSSSTPAPPTSTPGPMDRPSKPRPPAKPPAAEQSPDDSYFSAERQQLTESTASSESTAEMTENPEGPWECEHCTFINPKSTKVCTICCKTPANGYQPMKGKCKGRPKTRKAESTAAGQRRRDASSDDWAPPVTQSEEVPVLKSKLSISREKQQAKINLVSHVEKERVKTPKSSLKAGSSGTLKAGAIPPGRKVATAVTQPSSQKVKVKSRKQQQVVQVESEDDEEENDDEEEEEIEEHVEPVDDNAEEDEEDEEEESEEGKSEDDADDEENGVMSVKMTAGSTRSTREAAPVTRVKGMSTSKPPAVAAPLPKKLSKGRVSTKKLVDSNEDVYGSVPIQTLGISPKIDIKRSSKSKSATTGPSPPKQHTIETSPPPPTGSPPIAETTEASAQSEVTEKQQEPSEKRGKRKGSLASKTTETRSPVEDNVKESATETPAIDEPADSVEPPASTRPRKASVSMGIQTGSNSGNSKSTTASSSNGESETSSSSPFRARKELQADIPTSTVHVAKERKSSVGTSPPPQSISTQTYEDAVVDATPLTAAHKSLSKSSLRSGDEYEAPRPIEMSEKALRYARKARNKEQHHQKLKRSLSTQLYSAEPWLESGEGRHLYRSSSRQSLASDTRSLPMSGPPSRDSSPPPMRGGGSRWYEDVKRYQPPMFDKHPPPSDFFASIDDLMSRRRRESIRSQDFELTRMLKDAEDYNFSPEDVQVAIRMCGDRHPIRWLQDNWSSMIETVQSLAAKYGREKGFENNDVGMISSEEAKESLRANRGNVWAAVTECVDQRRKKYHELQSRGTFLGEDVLAALLAHRGNLEAAFVELSKAQLKPFLMRMWAPPTGTGYEVMPSSLPLEENRKASERRSEEMVASEGAQSLPLESSSTLPSAKHAKRWSIGGDDDSNEQPKLEKLVSNAEKVTQEIEKALKELKSTGMIAEKEIVDVRQEQPAPVLAEESSEVAENTSSLHGQVTTVAEVAPTQPEILPTNDAGGEEKLLQRQKSDDDSEVSSVAIAHVKSDGEDESFADAMSEAASNTNSPPPSRPAFDAVLVLNGETETVEVANDAQTFMEDELKELKEDVLELQIDEAMDAHATELIENYEIATEGTPNVEEQVDEATTLPLEGEGVLQSDEVDESEGAVGTEGVQPNGGDDKGISKGEIEQLLTTLTSTLSGMEEFAHKIKENIATEIQQQLAAAQKIKVIVSSHDHSEDGSYEPIELPPAIEENVNKKAAKYQRLAAKKKAKVGRHKSPETRAIQLGMVKETSLSPSPSASTTPLEQAEVEEPVDSHVASPVDSHVASPVDSNVASPVDNVDEEQMEPEAQGEDMEDPRFLAYEQVEIDQEDEEGDYEENEEEVELEVHEEDGDEEFIEEDVNESSMIEESEEDGVAEEENAPDDEHLSENGDDQVLDGEGSIADDDGANDEQYLGNEEDNYDTGHTTSITPSDTDKVIVAGGLTASKTIRLSSNNAVVILAEELTLTLSTENENSIKTDEDPEEKTDLGSGEVVSEETPAQRLITEGKADTLEHAELALQLIEMSFNEEDSFYAAKECSSLCSALSFLQQECDLCTGKFCAREMVSMLRCTHLCCRTCARDYFTVQVRDKTIVDATCPFCAEPSTLADDSELATEYFNHLDILLKNLLDGKHHEMFQRKLRDWTLAKTPNFKWCSKCSSGFITEPLQRRLVCPDCKAVTCAVCLETWDKINHDHRENTSAVKLCDTTPKSIIEYLNANCIECPRCHFRFSLARGGCMHLTCTQCHHEFCSGCSAPFRMGDKCEAKYPICDKLGLHAHHPRNCLFYLRDKEPDVLAKLLEENAIPYFKENSGEEQLRTEDESATADEDEAWKRRVCHVPIQRETSDGFADDICGKPAPEGYATVCKTHYIEYLGLLIWQNHLDPITILTNDDLEVIVRRAFKRHPGRPNWLSDEGFRKRLLKVINEEIPL